MTNVPSLWISTIAWSNPVTGFNPVPVGGTQAWLEFFRRCLAGSLNLLENQLADFLPCPNGFNGRSVSWFTEPWNSWAIKGDDFPYNTMIPGLGRDIPRHPKTSQEPFGGMEGEVKVVIIFCPSSRW